MRTVFVLLLTAVILAGCTDQFDLRWPAGSSEHFTYTINTFYPEKHKGLNDLTISRSDDGELLTVTQTLEVVGTGRTIRTVETYRAEGLELVGSENSFILEPEAAAQLEMDTIFVSARIENDRLIITNRPEIRPVSRLPLDGPLVTGIGAMLVTRDWSMAIGSVQNYAQVNLLLLGREPYLTEAIRDSVVSEENVVVPIGAFDCYRVMKLMPNIIGYTYYTRDQAHIPVMIQAFARETGEELMNIVLTGME